MITAFLQLHPIARGLQTVNAVRVGNKDDIGATDEKSAFNDSHHSPDLLFPAEISIRPFYTASPKTGKSQLIGANAEFR
jgi:hypothetical protein